MPTRQFPDHASLASLIGLALVLVGAPGRAERLPATVVPNHYDLSLAVYLAAARFDGIETILVEISQPTRTVVLHALEIAFRDVTIAAAGSTAQKATIALDEQQQTATLTVPKALGRGPADIHIS